MYDPLCKLIYLKHAAWFNHSNYAHAHHFRGISSSNLNHSHIVEFFTFPTNGNSTDGHFHHYGGVTKYAEKPVRHFHRYRGITGPAIPHPNGSHYHEVWNTVNDEPFRLVKGAYRTVFTIKRHTHDFSGKTGVELGTPTPGW
jgi:hypothetical protein